MAWKGRAILPRGATIGHSEVVLELLDGDTLLSSHPLKIRRFADWRGSVYAKESAVTSAEVEVRWESKAMELDLNTAWNIAFAGIDLSILDDTPLEVLNTGIRGISLDINCYENEEQRIEMNVGVFWSRMRRR